MTTSKQIPFSEELRMVILARLRSTRIAIREIKSPASLRSQGCVSTVPSKKGSLVGNSIFGDSGGRKVQDREMDNINMKNHAILENFITESEADEIVNYAKNYDKDYRTNRGGNTYCTVAWFKYNELVFSDLTSRINHFVDDINSRKFQITDLAPFTGQYQYTDYHEPGDAYGWHSDFTTNIASLAMRRLTITIALSNSDEYEGGGFELSDHWGHSSANKPADIYQSMLSLNDHERGLISKKGTLIIFPSHRMHKAIPITSGSRKVLVCWISGAIRANADK